MNNKGNNKGFALIFAILVAAIPLVIMTPLYSTAVSTYNMAKLDIARQQAYYNAHSGVEFAIFIIENSPPYDISNPNPISGSYWPLRNAGDTHNNIRQCFSDAAKGTFTITIADDGSGGYNITSVGTVPKTTSSGQDTIRTITAHYISGVINSWE